MLNPKQRLFVQEYLIDFNATRAATVAGYSAKTAPEQASRLLRNVKIASEVAKYVQKKSEKLDISVEYVLSTIKQTIERCSQAVPVYRDGKPTGQWREDSAAVLKGCELLGRYLKLFVDRVEVTGMDTFPLLLSSARQRIKELPANASSRSTNETLAN